MSGHARFYGSIEISDVSSTPSKARSEVKQLDPPSLDLFQALKETRLQIAREKGVPAFMIFSDATLREMAHHKPQTKKEFLSIKGVGNQKLDEYFEGFVSTIVTF